MVKKILCVIALLLFVTGCTSEKSEIPEFKIETHEVDMSVYNGLDAHNHHFLGTTVAELKRTIEEKGSGVFYLGYGNCEWCQDCLKYLEEVAAELDVKIYYLDAYSTEYPIVGDKEIFNTMKELLSPILKEEDGEKVVFTPHVFSIINGEFVGSQISTPEDWNHNAPTDEQIENLKNIYRNILKPFSK